MEYYLLHHLLDMLKDELVSIMASNYRERELRHVERILERLKPEPLWRIREYENVWSHLILKLKSELKEVVEDIISEKGFKKSFKRSIINKHVSLYVKLMLETLPPCILVDSTARVFINSRTLKAVWKYIRDNKTIDDKMIIAQIKGCVADYIKEDNLYKKELCPGECKPPEWGEKKWKQFVKSLNIPCPKIDKTEL